MYYEPQVERVRRSPRSIEEAVAVAEEWSSNNIDYVEQNTEDLEVGIERGTLALRPRHYQGAGYPLTKRAMVTLLKRMHLPTSLAAIFDPPKSSSYLAEHEVKVEYGLDFINGLLRDLKVPVVLRSRHDYIRAVLSPAEFILDYGDMMKHLANALRQIQSKVPLNTFFREFQPSDESLPVAVTVAKAPVKQDRLSQGFKVIFSENGETRNDVYSYVWRKVCANGLIAPVETAAWRLGIRQLKQNPARAIFSAVRSALTNANHLANASVELSKYALPDFKGEQRLEAINTVIDRLSGTIGLPRSLKSTVAAVWSAQPDLSLYGLQNAMTNLARQENNERRANLERAAGRLVFLPTNRLKTAVKV